MCKNKDFKYTYVYDTKKLNNNYAVFKYVSDLRKMDIDVTEFLLIGHLKEGKETLITDDINKEYTINTGDIFIIKPKEYHQIYVEKGGSFKHIVHFNKEEIKDGLKLVYQSQKELLELKDYDENISIPISNNILSDNSIIVDIMNKLCNFVFFNKNKEMDDILKNIYKQQLFFNLLEKQLIEKIDINEELQNKTIKSELIKRIYRSIDYIKENTSNRITIDELANVSNLSRFHYTRIFKNVTGKSPYQYIQDEKIKKAKAYLKNTNKSITEIAFLLGFSTQSAFSNFFFRIVGVSPSIFKNTK